jgi:hypothetical protein
MWLRVLRAFMLDVSAAKTEGLRRERKRKADTALLDASANLSPDYLLPGLPRSVPKEASSSLANSALRTNLNERLVVIEHC